MHINYWQTLWRDRLGRPGLLFISLILLMALFAPWLSGYQPAAYTKALFSPPSLKHWLGTNDVGQDIFTRLLYGARTSLIIGIGVGIISVFLSILIGATAALFGGLYDRITMRVVDALLVIPPVILAILVAAYLRPNILLLILILSLIMWPGGARVVRAQTLSLKERMHVSAARSFGANHRHVLIRHIIPEMGPILIAVLIQFIRRGIFMEAGLSFLGISDPAMISWGGMMQHALRFSYLKVWKWWLLPSGFALSLTIMGFVFLGYALETTLNPYLLSRND
jgi:peptide/nickel transport system permease protein